MHVLLAKSIARYYQNAKADLQLKVPLLFYLHASLGLFLLLTIVVIILFTPLANLLFYSVITVVSFVIIMVALVLNLRGRYSASTKLTVLIMFASPWASIVYESLTNSGDFMPLIFVIIPVQIAALFLATRSMLFLSVAQTISIICILVFNQNMELYNWVSLVCYIFVASLLGTVTSYVIRKQYDRLLASKEELAQSEHRLRDLSILDPLSGLYNRRYMAESFDRLIGSNAPNFAVIMLDVDHFKSINDTCGHTNGDLVLQTVAGILTATVRKDDIVCRYGGDEFLVILQRCGYEDALSKANEIQQKLNELGAACGNPDMVPITASIGIALFPDNGTDQETLLHAADTALYQAKKEGRNHVTALR